MNSQDARPACSGLSVLVLDDSRHLRDVVRAIFELEGAVVFEAATLGEARTLLEKGAPDAIVTDLEVCSDERAGVVILEHVKRQSVRCAVLLLTGRAEASDDLRNVGFDAILLKPTPTTTLIATLLAAVRRCRALRREITTAA